MVQNAFCPVQLLCQKHSGKLMRPGHRRKTEALPAALQHSAVQTKRPPDNKSRALLQHIVALAQKFRKFLRCATLAPVRKGYWRLPGCNGCQNAFSLLAPARLRSRLCIAIADFRN